MSASMLKQCCCRHLLLLTLKDKISAKAMGFSGLPLLSPLSPKRSAIVAKVSVMVIFSYGLLSLLPSYNRCMYTAVNFKAVFGHSKW